MVINYLRPEGVSSYSVLPAIDPIVEHFIARSTVIKIVATVIKIWIKINYGRIPSFVLMNRIPVVPGP